MKLTNETPWHTPTDPVPSEVVPVPGSHTDTWRYYSSYRKYYEERVRDCLGDFDTEEERIMVEGEYSDLAWQGQGYYRDMTENEWLSLLDMALAKRARL